MGTRVEAQTSQNVSDYDYSNFFYSASEDPFAILEPYNEWFGRALPRGYYLYAQAMGTPPRGTITLTEGLDGERLRLVNLSSYNYLGLSYRPEVIAAGKAALELFGLGAAGSPILSGTMHVHARLEHELAQFKQKEAVMIFPTGYSTNVGLMQGLMRPGDWIIADQNAHASIVDGAIMSKANVRFFRHNNPADLERKLKQTTGKKLVAIEGVYSMDGDSPDLPRFIELKKKYGCLLMVDEAHSIGVMGKTGAGIGEHFGVVRADVDLWMGTLSKSFASCGGYIGASKQLVQFLKYSAGGFVYSVGISPANTAAALEALRQLKAHPEKVARIHERAGLFLKLAKEKGIDTGFSEGSAVVPAILGNSLHALQVSDALKRRGINVQPILYPAVEETAARLRFFCTATHTDQQIRETVQVLAEEIARARADSGDSAATGSL